MERVVSRSPEIRRALSRVNQPKLQQNIMKIRIEIEVMSCPFCGNDDNLSLSSDCDENAPEYLVKCYSCGTQGPEDFVEKNALEKWNTRK
jgi:Lar family restriction alleviation protein